MPPSTHTLRWTPAWLATAWLLVVLVVYLSLARLTPDVHVGHGDKLAHAFAYAVMTFWFMQIYAAPRARLAIALGLALLGVVLEILQGYTGYRTFDYLDMAANAIGVVVGWLAAPPRVPRVLSFIERCASR